MNIEENNSKLQYFKLKQSKNYNKIEENWLKLEIIGLIKYGVRDQRIQIIRWG